jgi:hypothetical protein
LQMENDRLQRSHFLFPIVYKCYALTRLEIKNDPVSLDHFTFSRDDRI